MSTLTLRRWVVAGVLLAPSAASAAPLSVVTVSAPDINCVFDTDCTVTVTDSVATIAIPNLIAGAARLQSRTYVGKPGAQAAGKTGYEYRLDLTTAVTSNEFSCVTDLEIDFGEITKLHYDRLRPRDDVFVVAQGGVGTIGILFAEQAGPVITFTFSQPVCAGNTPGTGQSTFFFGLASEYAPKGIVAHVGVPALPPADVRARAPDHPQRPIRPLADTPAAAPDQAGAAPGQPAETGNR
jgi:hypothetical protein